MSCRRFKLKEIFPWCDGLGKDVLEEIRLWVDFFLCLDVDPGIKRIRCGTKPKYRSMNPADWTFSDLQQVLKSKN